MRNPGQEDIYLITLKNLVDKTQIINYYDYTLPFYHWFWYGNSSSYALHYGLWDKNTKNLSEALINTNKFLARKAKVKNGDKILDAGCGTGGSSIWLATNFKVHIVGITISQKQLEQAQKLAKKNKVEDQVTFLLRDYLETGFKDDSFDVIWAIESVCHAENKKKF